MLKARLIEIDNQYKLLTSNGKIRLMSYEDVCDFLLNYDNNEYYYEEGVWDYSIPIELIQGITIATVSDEDILTIFNSSYCRTFFVSPTSDIMLNSVEYAALHNKNRSVVRRHCNDGKIPGAVLRGNQWFIPANAPYPQGARNRKNG